jgi:hypothetical protein
MGSWVSSVLLAVSVAFGASLGVAAGDSLADLQARFDRETDSVRKAKLFNKLGDKQFDETRRASRDRDYQTVGLVMEKYRDNARVVLDALKKDHPNAERHTGGYKPLQMHIHRALRELDELIIISPAEYRPPLELVRQDLLAVDDDLLKLLFPRRLETKKPEAPPAPPEKQP